MTTTSGEKPKTMKSGIELIAKERHEQLTKHGRTIEMDVLNNGNYQLSEAATKLAADSIGGYWPTETLPVGWDQEIWDKMTNKSYEERLIIAGALIAAEIDRLQNS
jgi:hypothetical protein